MQTKMMLPKIQRAGMSGAVGAADGRGCLHAESRLGPSETSC